ncbi:MAG TPA: hypothetical protein VHX17_05400 [Candidatus Cybelea sp.]|jgi:hypothetical protein|nr:hypothetical protein [Candidatus Cybelea sp.]
MNEKRYWFKRRRFGLGWSPKSWEGWAVTGALVLLQAALPAIAQRFGAQRRVSPKLRLAISGAFVVLALLTGEPLA